MRLRRPALAVLSCAAVALAGCGSSGLLEGDSASELARLGSLGASTAGTGQCGEGWTAMTDPDGNEFCLRAETSRLPG